MGLHGLTDEVEEEYRRALELFEGEREVPQLFPVLRGLSSLHGYRAEFDKAFPLAYELLRLADAQGDQTTRVDAHLLVGVGMAFTNDLQGGIEHLEKAVECFESQRLARIVFSSDRTPGSRATRPRRWSCGCAGFPTAPSNARTAPSRWRRTCGIRTRWATPCTTGFLHLLMQEPELVHDRAVSVVDVAEEYELPIWRAVGIVLLGAAKTDMGRFEEVWPISRPAWTGTRGCGARRCSGPCFSTCALGHAPGQNDRPRGSTSSTRRSRSPAAPAPFHRCSFR